MLLRQRIHVARSRHIILVERGRRASRTLYMEFHVGVGAGKATAQIMLMAYQHADVPVHTVERCRVDAAQRVVAWNEDGRGLNRTRT